MEKGNPERRTVTNYWQKTTTYPFHLVHEAILKATFICCITFAWNISASPTDFTKMAEETVLQSVLIVFGNDKILKLRIKDGVTIDLKQAKIINENMRKHATDGRIPVLIDARVSYNWNKDAQQYLADNSDFRLATAVLSDNPFSRLLTNTFVKIFKPVYPVKLFTDEEKAIEWLNQFKDSKI